MSCAVVSHRSDELRDEGFSRDGNELRHFVTNEREEASS